MDANEEQAGIFNDYNNMQNNQWSAKFILQIWRMENIQMSGASCGGSFNI